MPDPIKKDRTNLSFILSENNDVFRCLLLLSGSFFLNSLFYNGNLAFIRLIMVMAGEHSSSCLSGFQCYAVSLCFDKSERVCV